MKWFLPHCLANFKHQVLPVFYKLLPKARHLSEHPKWILIYYLLPPVYSLSYTCQLTAHMSLPFFLNQSFRPQLGAFFHLFSHWLFFLQGHSSFQTCFSKIILPVLWRFSLVDGQLGCFCLLFVMNNAMNNAYEF